MRSLTNTTLERRAAAARSIIKRQPLTNAQRMELLALVVWPGGGPNVEGQAVWTKQDVIDAMRRWVKGHDRWPRSQEWQVAVNGYPTYSAVRNLFGSWRDALAAAGCDTSRADYLDYVPEELEEADPGLGFGVTVTQEELGEMAALDAIEEAQIELLNGAGPYERVASAVLAAARELDAAAALYVEKRDAYAEAMKALPMTDAAAIRLASEARGTILRP